MTTPEPIEHVQPPRQMRLRYAGTCVRCGKSIGKGVQAFYDPNTQTVNCVKCDVQAAPPSPDDPGHAGASAQREYDRRSSAREARVRAALGNMLGGVVLALTDEPQSTRAWQRGAIGERRLAESLDGVPGLKILNDRRVPHTRGNIDHIVITSAGVFVVDAKLYKGLIKLQDVGGFFKTDLRLFVGRRDCSQLAQNMGWQIDAVQRALAAAGLDPPPLVRPVLCFVDGEWPMFSPPSEYNGVCLEGKRSIRKLISDRQILDAASIDRIYHSLAVAFPPK